MHNHNPSTLFDHLTNIDPVAVIPVIEKGLELEKLQSVIDNSAEAERRVRHSRALLCILRTLRLGL
jgi:hypothetical protein